MTLSDHSEYLAFKQARGGRAGFMEGPYPGQMSMINHSMLLKVVQSRGIQKETKQTQILELEKSAAQ